MEGKGTISLPIGEYTGQWMDDQMNGEGKLTRQERGVIMIYEGTWEKGEIVQGTITYYDNSSYNTSKNSFVGKYEGRIQQGKRNGWGKYYWPSHQNRSQIAV